MILEDLILLGRTEPQQTKHNGVTVCSAGFSKELGEFVRVYPLDISAKVSRWDVVRANLERSPNDTHKESWKLQSGTVLEKHSSLASHKPSRQAVFDALKVNQAASIADLNARRLSLGVLQPKSMHMWLKPRKDFDDKEQQLSFLDERVIRPMPFVPYLSVVNQDGTQNNIQLRDWGAAEFQRKGHSANDLCSAYRLDQPDYEHLILVGNTKLYRNVWIGISIISMKATNTIQLSFQPSLFA